MGAGSLTPISRIYVSKLEPRLKSPRGYCAVWGCLHAVETASYAVLLTGKTQAIQIAGSICFCDMIIKWELWFYFLPLLHQGNLRNKSYLMESVVLSLLPGLGFLDVIKGRNRHTLSSLFNSQVFSPSCLHALFAFVYHSVSKLKLLLDLFLKYYLFVCVSMWVCICTCMIVPA